MKKQTRYPRSPLLHRPQKFIGQANESESSEPCHRRGHKHGGAHGTLHGITPKKERGEPGSPLVLPEIKCVGKTPAKARKTNEDLELEPSIPAKKSALDLDDDELLLLVPRPTCIYKLNRNIKINIRSPKSKLQPLQSQSPFYTKIRQTG